MNYNIKGTGLTLTPEIYSYLDKRLALHIEKFLSDHPAAILDVELELKSGEASANYRAEFTCTNGKDVHRTEANGASLHEVIDIAVDELQDRLAREKGKKLHLIRRQALRIKNIFRGFRH